MSETKIIDLKTKTPEQKEPKKRVTWKQIVLFSVLAVVLFCLIAVVFLNEALNLDRVYRFFKYLTVDKETYGRYTFDASASNSYAGFDDGLAIASQTQITVFGASGERVGTVQASLSTPLAVSTDRFVIGYDVGGSNITMLDRSGTKVYSESVGGTLVDLDANEDGCVVYAASGGGYKTELVLLNTEHKPSYRWGSNTQYFNCCAVSDDADMIAAVGVGAEETDFLSKAVLIRTDKTEIYREVSLGTQIIYELHFFDDGSLCAIGENSTTVISPKGKILQTYDYSEEYLMDYAVSEDSVVLTISRYSSGTDYRVAVLDDEGEVLGEKSYDEAVVDVAVCGKYVAVLTAGELKICHRSLEKYATAENKDGALCVIQHANGTALLVGGGRASLFIP
ncbi:MAG: DUF5711 family protein [Clostridia bacterium]|nr:DUF5711 family protein [Clostridia bacterium]